MLENVEVFTQSSICIHGNKKVYFDPYQVPKDFHDADFILITHDHYDHFSVGDILKVKKDDTVFVAPMDVIEKVQTIFSSNQMYAVEPNQTLEIENLSIRTVPAYNVAKTYHPQAASWVGYVIRLDGVTYYVLYFLLIFALTFFYASIMPNMQPKDIATNLKKYGSSIPGVKPGKPTAEALDKILSKTTFIGALGLGIVALIPSLASYITNIKTLQGIGATSLIIMVGVALDLINQVRTHLLARNYESFLKE